MQACDTAICFTFASERQQRRSKGKQGQRRRPGKKQGDDRDLDGSQEEWEPGMQQSEGGTDGEGDDSYASSVGEGPVADGGVVVKGKGRRRQGEPRQVAPPPEVNLDPREVGGSVLLRSLQGLGLFTIVT
jgi:hypothetical protein